MQLHHVAAGIVHEELRGVRAGQALDHPILHAQALKLGPVTYLTPGEARICAETIEKQLGRAYELWERRVSGKK